MFGRDVPGAGFGTGGDVHCMPSQCQAELTPLMAPIGPTVESPTTQTSSGAMTVRSRINEWVEPAGAAGDKKPHGAQGSTGCGDGVAGKPQRSRSRSELSDVTPGWL